jgi:hypothetical protein
MGIPVELAPHLIRLMSSEDAARYCVATTSNKTGRRNCSNERREQGDFANWLLLQNSQGRKMPFVWHATHRASRATPGTADFWAGVNGRSLWIEFKRDQSCRLTPEQDEFRLACEAQRIEWRVVYSADEAIEIVATANTANDTTNTFTRTTAPRRDALTGPIRGCVWSLPRCGPVADCDSADRRA